MPFEHLVSREGGVAELPHGMADEIITGTMHESAVLRLAHTVRTDTRDSRIPVLVQQPEAGWVSGDSGLKGTGRFALEHQAVIAEELATIVAIPDAVLDDSEVSLWRQIRPLLVKAFGRKLDDAVLWGAARPTSWSTPDLFTDAVAAGNTVETTTDPAADLLNAAELVSTSGFTPSGVVVRPGWQYSASARRTQALTANPVDGIIFLSVGGLPITTDPIRWDRTLAEAIVADWSCVIVGIRQDIKLEIFRTGVLSDEAGVVQLNLLQQDTSALRATFRVGALLAKPVTDTGAAGTQSPVSVVLPAGSAYAS